MNSDSTKHGPYEYDRNSALIGRPYEMARCEDCGEFHAYVYCRDKILRMCPYLRSEDEELDKPGIGLKTVSIWITLALILVFAGVVLWKVWVG